MANNKNIQSRKWQGTINNPLDHGLDQRMMKLRFADSNAIDYYCMADEIGLETQTPHTHFFICCRSPMHFSTLKNLFPMAHLERVKGTVQENIDYIKKEGKWADDPKADTKVEGSFYEWGEIPDEPGQGYRSDIAEMFQMINDGLSNAQIMFENPKLAQFSNKMDKIRQDVVEERYRNIFRHLKVTYIWGATETGKTRGIMEKHGYREVYRVTDYAHPFDRYNMESVMCFDEFRSNLPIGDMLQYLDGYPISLPARYANRAACYETVYIISNISLKQQYPTMQKEQEETWKAFLRRIHKVVEYRQDGKIIDHGSAMDYFYPQAWLDEPLSDEPLSLDFDA